jgi:hypothetical protein
MPKKVRFELLLLSLVFGGVILANPNFAPTAKLIALK